MIDQMIDNEGWNLADLAESVFLFYFEKSFNAQNFFLCFNYMKDYLDFEGTSDRGRWYMRSVLLNLGVTIFRWIKANKSEDVRKNKVMLAYDMCALNPLGMHNGIELDDFQQLTQKYRYQKETKKRDFSAVNAEFVPIESMPGKVPRGYSDQRSKPLDEFDEEYGDEDDGLRQVDRFRRELAKPRRTREREELETIFGGDATFDAPVPAFFDSPGIVAGTLVSATSSISIGPAAEDFIGHICIMATLSIVYGCFSDDLDGVLGGILNLVSVIGSNGCLIHGINVGGSPAVIDGIVRP